MRIDFKLFNKKIWFFFGAKFALKKYLLLNNFKTKKMRKLILTFLLLGPGLISFAQQDSMQMKKKTMMHSNDSMQMNREMMMHNMDSMKMHTQNYDKLKTDLGLSDKQVTEWKMMDKNMKPNMEKMHQQHMAQMEQMHQKHQAEMEKMQQQHDEKIKSILTEEQYEKYLKNKPMPKGDKMGMPKHGHNGPPPPPKN